MLCVTITIVYSLFQLTDQFFHFCRRDWIERGTRLVHQDDLRFDGKRARDAKPLLLAAGKSVAADVEPIFHFIPKRGGAQTFLDRFIDPRALCDAGDAQTVGDVVVNRFRKRIRFLKNHPDAPAEIDHVHPRRVDIDAFDADRAA